MYYQRDVFPPSRKEHLVERSLSVLMPVHNAQSSLAATVQQVLEVVSELTETFELVIIDDGSDDATSEVAHELTHHYPQVHAVFHRHCQGREAAIRSGFQHSTGEIIFLCDEISEATLGETAKLWRAACHREPAVEIPARSGDKWARVSAGHPIGESGNQMVDRKTMEKVQRASQPSGPNYLARLRNFAWDE